MVSVRFCRRSADGLSPETVQLPASCLTQPVATVRAAAAHMLGLAPSQLELVFRGRPLVNDRLMTSYELSSSSVLHAFRRPPPPADAAATRSADAPDGTQLAWTLQQLTQDPVRRHTVTQRLGRPEVLQRLLRAVPALESDPIALALLQEPALLLQVASPRANVKRLVAAHPVLADMAGPLAAVLRACERNPGPAGGSASGASQSRAPPASAAAADERAGDQGSFDDDEDDDDDEPVAPAGAAPAAAGSVPPITREQLASALAAAVPNLAAASAAAAAAGASAAASPGQAPVSRPGSGRPAAPAMQQSTPQQSTPPQQQQAAAQLGVISPQMVSAALREAMRALPTAQRAAPAPQMAQQQSPAPPPQPPAAAVQPAADPPAVQQPAVDEAAFRQLLELGITTNESLVRQALLFSDGNIDHAVEFIYASLQ